MYAAALLCANPPALGQDSLIDAAAAAWPRSGHGEPRAPVANAQARDTLERINRLRAAGATCGTQRFAAAQALGWNPQLEQAALKHAQDMAARRALSHTGSDGSRMSDRVGREAYAWSALGENVSAGYPNVAEGLAGWMKSPGHCANLMSPAFRDVGMGAALATVVPGDTDGWYRAMVLGSPAR